MNERSTDRALAHDLITLLRTSGLMRGGAQIEQMAVFVPLIVRPGTPVIDVVEAITAAYVHAAPKLVAALRDRLVIRDRGLMHLRVKFGTPMSAMNFQGFANQVHP